MKRFFNIFAIALVSVLMFSCQKDADVDNFGLGGTVNGKFQLVIPSNELVEITRATEAEESEVKNVTLFYFDAEGNALYPTDLGNKNYEQIVLGNAQTSGNYTRTYTIGTKAKFATGDVVTVYAIANTDSNLGSVDDFTAPEVAGNHEKFTNLLMSMSSLNESFSTMVMSGSVQATGWNNGLIGTIQVKRPYAKVNFTIKNGTSNFTFTPTQYNVKNVPTSGAVFEGVKAENVKFTNYDDMTDFVENQGAQVIEFYMLENQAGNANSNKVKDYNDRELRKDADPTVNGGKHEEFAHGLANATYVEILGEGKGTNAKGEPISATVKYTIHLGDFAADATDFNVNRNTFYNYTVTVNGVENIVVEAESKAMDDEKFQHGAEGTVINLEGSTMVYTLDAHYEQVLLNLNLTALPTKDNDVVLVVSTPYMDEANKGAMITWADIESTDFGSKFDTEWVEFYPANALCAYPGANNTMSTVDFLMYVKGLATDGNESNNKLSVVAYINEYFYNSHPLDSEKKIHWSDFVNKEDRVMRILQKPDISKDGHSISTKALCSFTQRSIRTVFNTKAGGRPFGIENFDETGAISEYGSASNYSSSIITESKHGYGADGQPNGNVYNALASQSAANACQQRNRAGSNNVWKLATPSQYTAIWLGEQALPNEAKLYKGNPADNLTIAPGWNGSYNGVYQHWTSGDDDNRIFWHVEGAAFSPRGWSDASAHFARCVRDLNGETEATPNAEWVEDKRMIIVKNFTESAYRGIATQNLPVHHERDAANKVTKAFVVASNNLSATWKAMSDAPAVPDIVSVSKAGNSLTIWFANKDTYVYAKSATTGIEQFTNVVLGDGNSVVINNPSGTYYFRTRRNYETLSQYVTVNADGTYSNTAGGEATAAYSINAGSTNKNSSNIPMMAAMNQDLCAQYTAESANGTAWRVPNQKELLLMRELDKKKDIGLKNPSGGFLSSNPWFLTSTMFSARNLAETEETKRYGFTWYYNFGEAFGLQAYNSTGAVRCVRDASEAELQSLVISNSGDQEDGGDA
ncbi:MAG: DUF4906 domain-containing protein [Rikenellaceae bacterium]|nr:DUF4906 domain-containing protein [Rikenellaceae bacterium]